MDGSRRELGRTRSIGIVVVEVVEGVDGVVQEAEGDPGGV